MLAVASTRMIPTVIDGARGSVSKKKREGKKKKSSISVFAFNQAHGRRCWKRLERVAFEHPLHPRKVLFLGLINIYFCLFIYNHILRLQRHLQSLFWSFSASEK